MTAEEIIKEYPKTIEKLTERFKGAELPQGYTPEMMVGNLLAFAPRQLFDFFDENKINIIIYNEHSSRWLFDLFNNNELVEIEEKDFKSRSDAERAAYIQAFQISEKLLNN